MKMREFVDKYKTARPFYDQDGVLHTYEELESRKVPRMMDWEKSDVEETLVIPAIRMTVREWQELRNEIVDAVGDDDIQPRRRVRLAQLWSLIQFLPSSQ